MQLRLKKQFHKGMQSWMTPREEIHPQLTLTSKRKLFIVYWYSGEVNLFFSHHLAISKDICQVFSFPLCVHLSDETDWLTTPSFFCHKALFLFKCKTTLNTYGGNTFGITLGSFTLLHLISSLYYSVLDILLWRKLHKVGFNNSWRQI